MTIRLSNFWRQLACVAVASASLYPTWTARTPVSEVVFGVAWLSFILAIFVTRPGGTTTSA